MNTFKLTENYRAATNVLDYVNGHKPNSNSGCYLEHKNTDLKIEPGNVCAPPNQRSLSSCKCVNDPENVRSLVQKHLERNETVAFLCRTNAQVARWHSYLRDNQNNPIIDKTKIRRIDENPIRVHRLLPVWKFFHGPHHLHPVPTIVNDSEDMGKHENPYEKALKETWNLTGNFNWKDVSYPNKSNGTANLQQVKETFGTIQRIDQDKVIRWSDAKAEMQSTFIDKLEVIDKQCSYDFAAQFNDMLTAIDDEISNSSELSWSGIWRRFEHHYDEILNQIPRGKVIVSNIHQCKGLEFDTVFLWDWCCKQGAKDTVASELKQNDKTDCNDAFSNSTVLSEMKVFYVGCSRPRKNLYVIPPDVEPRQEKGKDVPRLASLNQCSNIYLMRPAFYYKDPDNREWDFVFSDFKDPKFVEQWSAINSNSKSLWKSTVNQFEDIQNCLRQSGQQRVKYRIAGDNGAVYMDYTPCGDYPILLPMIVPSRIDGIKMIKKSSGTEVVWSASPNEESSKAPKHAIEIKMTCVKEALIFRKMEKHKEEIIGWAKEENKILEIALTGSCDMYPQPSLKLDSDFSKLDFDKKITCCNETWMFVKPTEKLGAARFLVNLNQKARYFRYAKKLLNDIFTGSEEWVNLKVISAEFEGHGSSIDLVMPESEKTLSSKPIVYFEQRGRYPELQNSWQYIC